MVRPQKAPLAVPLGNAACPTKRPGTPHRLRSARKANRKTSLSPSEKLNQNFQSSSIFCDSSSASRWYFLSMKMAPASCSNLPPGR